MKIPYTVDFRDESLLFDPERVYIRDKEKKIFLKKHPSPLKLYILEHKET